MSDFIKHECGVVLIRLLKPLDYYVQKYGTAFYGLNKLQFIMLKLRHRGQDGAGIATIKLNTTPGERYISRRRSVEAQPLRDIFDGVFSHFSQLSKEQMKDAASLKANYPYMGELLMGHLRYGTHGKNNIENVHPFLRQSNWINRNLVLAGNFNMTNVDEMFDELIQIGQYPKQKADTVTVLEKIGHFLDDEVQRLHTWFKPDGYSNQNINNLIVEHLDVQRLLRRSSKKYDGGYCMVGMIGHGDSFVMRDPNGIRPAFYYYDDEIVVAASERPCIQTAFNVHISQINEINPGHALIIKANGKISEVPFIEPRERKACSFERIYFSKGSDKDIYLERKKLGELLAKPVLKMIDYDLENTVFSAVPNTSEVAFSGLVDGLENELNQIKKEKILKLSKKLTPEELENILNIKVRAEKVVVKDEKQRTFIADDASRGELVSHVYDVTYGLVRNEKDTVVLLDDSIVRGTTLRDSILRIVARLKPKRIIVLSSSPQIRFPDCYGIDMSKMGEFVAFQALIELLKEHKKEHLIQEVYEKCKAQEALPVEEVKNQVTQLYKAFSIEQISAKIAEIVTPKNIDKNIKIDMLFQTIEGLHQACPNHKGDWYFTGNFPTPGGHRVANRAFINYVNGNNERAY